MLNLRSILTAHCRVHLSLLLISLSLTSCGGSGNDGVKSYPQLTISGTAATGSPIANAQLTFKCMGGTTIQIYTYYDSTDANGAYSKRVDAASAPCVITVKYVSSGATLELSSYVKTLTSNTVSNITPLTDTLLKVMMGGGFSTSKVGSNQLSLNKLKAVLSENKDLAAWTTLKNNLTQLGFDTSVINSDPVTDILLADPSHVHQGHDGLLDELTIYGMLKSQLFQLAGGGERFESVAQTDSDVLDKVTDLVWQRCVIGMVWNGSTCTGTPDRKYWRDLPQLVATQPLSPAPNASPWRVPTLSELKTLHDIAAPTAPYIADTSWFPETPAEWTWSSTERVLPAYPSVVSWILGFHTTWFPYAGGENTDQLVVRLVR